MRAQRCTAKSPGFQPLAERQVVKISFKYQVHPRAFRHRLSKSAELFRNLALEELPFVPVQLTHSPQMACELTTLNEFGDGCLDKKRGLSTANLLSPEQGLDHRLRDHQIAHP